MPMETGEENVCRKKRQCITSYRTFNNICLDRDILEVCIRHGLISELTNSIFPWKASAKQPIVSLLSGNMGNWVEGTDESYLLVQ